jgi:hypothetical protein
LLEAQTLQAYSFLVVVVGHNLPSHDFGGPHPLSLVLATINDPPSYDHPDHNLDHGLPPPLSWLQLSTILLVVILVVFILSLLCLQLLMVILIVVVMLIIIFLLLFFRCIY